MTQLFLWSAWLVLLLRNFQTYRVRKRFIWHEPSGFYEALPSYHRMLLCHWGKWTVAQWRRYVRARIAGEAA